MHQNNRIAKRWSIKNFDNYKKIAIKNKRMASDE